MQKMDNTTEHATAQDFFKFLGVVITFIFGAFFFFLKLLGSSSDTDEDPIAKQNREYNDLTSSSPEARLNPMNIHND